MDGRFVEGLLWLILVLAILGGITSVIAVAPQRDILVGQGCEGPSSIAVSYEEDRLPVCQRIDRHIVQ